MPRISPRLLRRAQSQSPFLKDLLFACRDLQSAKNELRWIKEHVSLGTHRRNDLHLSRLCRRRAQGVPLQYILGSQPFGSLDIQCRPGVLIPRPETEAYTCHIADLVLNRTLLSDRDLRESKGLNILDICTGTGCIPLLLYDLLRDKVPALSILGLDISPTAIQLAKENASSTVTSSRSDGHELDFRRADVFNDEDMRILSRSRWDVLISNPPYISTSAWKYGKGQLSYSVRKSEPKLALVPGNHLALPKGWLREDIFYARIWDVARQLSPEVLALEVGDELQARRILGHVGREAQTNYQHVQLWRDWPDATTQISEPASILVRTNDGVDREVPVIGSGHIRCIIMFR